MGKVKELQIDIQYILNVLSSHGEQKAVEAFENVLSTLNPETKTITHIHNGDVREIIVPCSNGMVDSNGDEHTIESKCTNGMHIPSWTEPKPDEPEIITEIINGDVREYFKTSPNSTKAMSEPLTCEQACKLAIEQTPELVSGGNTLFDISVMYANRVWDDDFTNAWDALLGLLQKTFPEYEQS